MTSTWKDWADRKEELARYSDAATTDTAGTEEATPVPVGMDDYFFQDFVRGCRNVVEATSYLEIFNYSVCAAAVFRRARATARERPGAGAGAEVCWLSEGLG